MNQNETVIVKINWNNFVYRLWLHRIAIMEWIATEKPLLCHDVKRNELYCPQRGNLCCIQGIYTDKNFTNINNKFNNTKK